jgi:hypothetical protein
MDALLTAAIYVVPFLAFGIAARWWLARRNIALSDVEAEGDPSRKGRSVFLLGAWRDRRD